MISNTGMTPGPVYDNGATGGSSGGGAGLAVKQPARAGTIVGGNITLAGGAPNTLDGVTLAANDRILVKDQTAPAENGIYTVTTLGTGVNGTWTRASDMDATGEATGMTLVGVLEGTANARTYWYIITTGTITIGTTSMTWSLLGPRLTRTTTTPITGNGQEEQAYSFDTSTPGSVIAVTLPDVTTIQAGKRFTYKNEDGSFNVTLTPFGAQTIDETAGAFSLVNEFGQGRASVDLIASPATSNWLRVGASALWRMEPGFVPVLTEWTAATATNITLVSSAQLSGNRGIRALWTSATALGRLSTFYKAGTDIMALLSSFGPRASGTAATSNSNPWVVLSRPVTDGVKISAGIQISSSGTLPVWIVKRWTTLDTDSGVTFGVLAAYRVGVPLWYRLVLTGGNIEFQTSTVGPGGTWNVLYSGTVAATFGSAGDPTRVEWGGSMFENNTGSVDVLLEKVQTA